MRILKKYITYIIPRQDSFSQSVKASLTLYTHTISNNNTFPTLFPNTSSSNMSVYDAPLTSVLRDIARSPDRQMIYNIIRQECLDNVIDEMRKDTDFDNLFCKVISTIFNSIDHFVGLNYPLFWSVLLLGCF